MVYRGDKLTNRFKAANAGQGRASRSGHAGRLGRSGTFGGGGACAYPPATIYFIDCSIRWFISRTIRGPYRQHGEGLRVAPMVRGARHSTDPGKCHLLS